MTKQIARTRFIWLTIIAGLLITAAMAFTIASADTINQNEPNAPTADPRLRVAHLAPFAPGAGTAVTVTLNGNAVLTDFNFLDSTSYITVPEGPYLVEIFPDGSATPAITGNVDLAADTDYTAVAIGDGVNQALSLLAVADDNSAPASGEAKLRLGHLAPFADTITDTLADVRLQDGTPILESVPFGVIAGTYLNLPAAEYDLKITAAGGAPTLIDLAPVTLNDGDIVDAYAVGDGANQDLGVFLWPSSSAGVSGPLGINANLQVIHLAPFATGPDTAVTVSLNGGDVLTDFVFGESTAYISVPAGSYDVAVTPNGASDPAITGTVSLAAGNDYTAVAIGDGSNQDLALLPLLNNNAAPEMGNAHLRLGHLAPFAAGNATADVRLQDGTAVLEGVNFGDVAGYLPLPAGEYDLKITTPGGDTTLIDLMPVTLDEGVIYTAFAVGDGTNEPVGAFVMADGMMGGLADLATQLQVVHLAPFATGDAAVDIALNGTTAITDFVYGESTEYLTIPADDYFVEIFPAGTNTAAITANVTLEQAMMYSAIANGDGNNQSLSITPLADMPGTPANGTGHVRIGHFAPFAMGDATADIRLQDGTPVITNVNYADVTAFFPLPAGEYDLKVTTPGGDTTLIDPRPFTLGDGDILAAYAAGDGTNQDVGVFAVPFGQMGSFLPLAGEAQLRVAHLAPFASEVADTSVEVRLNGTAVLTDFVYGDSTGYLTVDSGSYLVEIVPSGTDTVAISGTVELMDGMDYTAVATGNATNQDLALQALADDNTAPMAGMGHVRIAHFAPFALGDATADVRLQDGTPVITNVNYADVASYLPLPAGEYDLKVTTPGGDTTLIDPAPFTLNEGDILDAYATGDITNQAVAIFAWPNTGMGMFLPAAEGANLQVIHLAPFASDSADTLAGTAVEVRLNGTTVLTNFVYGDSTTYLNVEAGSYLVEILPQGTETVAISATVELMEGMDYTAVATGDGSNQPLALQALLDDNSAPPAGEAKLRLGHFAPFANGDATADIRLQDGTPVITGVNYADVADYISLPAGEYDLKVTTPDGESTLIEVLPITLNEGNIVSAFATGDGVNQDTAVFATINGGEGIFLPDSYKLYLPLIMTAP